MRWPHHLDQLPLTTSSPFPVASAFVSAESLFSFKSCLTLCNPMDCSTPGFPVLHCLPEFAQTHVHRVSDTIQPSHPLSSPFPPTLNLSQHQGLFQWVEFQQSWVLSYCQSLKSCLSCLLNSVWSIFPWQFRGRDWAVKNFLNLPDIIPLAVGLKTNLYSMQVKRDAQGEFSEPSILHKRMKTKKCHKQKLRLYLHPDSPKGSLLMVHTCDFTHL